jgi:hypothetical protein
MFTKPTISIETKSNVSLSAKKKACRGFSNLHASSLHASSQHASSLHASNLHASSLHAASLHAASLHASSPIISKVRGGCRTPWGILTLKKIDRHHDVNENCVSEYAGLC